MTIAGHNGYNSWHSVSSNQGTNGGVDLGMSSDGPMQVVDVAFGISSTRLIQERLWIALPIRGEWRKSGHRLKRDRVGKNRKYKFILKKF